MKAPSPETRQINPKAARYDLRIGHSLVDRCGVFALEDIPRGRCVIEYTGKRLTYEQVWNIEAPKDFYLARLNAEWFLDGSSGGSGAQFVNHSCDPNLLWRCLRNRLLFFSRRKIHAGEELTVDYHYPVKLQRVLCHCGARRCRGTFRYILS
jgi:SET domain-containing protein